jgi:hypothetical protein
MSVRETVRDAQRRLAALDADYARAVAKLNRASARRAEVLREQGRLVAIAQEDVDRTVVAMADAVGAQMTANLLGLDPANVRRLVKSGGAAFGGSDPAGPDCVRQLAGEREP